MEDEKEQGDPNKETMLEPGEGDASGLLPTDGGYDDSDADAKPSDTDMDPAGPPADTDTDTEDDDNPDLALLRDAGVDGTYRTVPAALAGITEKERYIEQQRRDNEMLRTTLQQAYQNRPQGQAAQPKTNEDMAELFASDPEAALRQLGYVSRDQVTPLVTQLNTISAQMEQQAFVGALDQNEELRDVATTFRAGRQPARGENAMWDAMDDLYRSSPSLSNANMTDLIPVLYNAAKQQLSATPVDRVSDDKKRGASTTSKGRGSRPKKGDAPDFNGMTEKQIFDWHQERGLVS